MAWRGLLRATVAILISSSQLPANTYLFATASNATVNGLPVDVQVQIDVRSPTYMVISVLNLEANPTSDTQTVNAVTFDFASSLAGLGTISFSSSAVPVTLKSNGTYTLGPAAETGWATAATSAGTSLTLFSLCDLRNTTIGCATTRNGTAWGGSMLVGPPGSSDTYTTSGGGALDKPKYNPLLFEEADFYVTITKSVLNPNATAPPITNMLAGFGPTNQYSSVLTYEGYATPEAPPALLILCGTALIGMSRLRRKVL